MKQTGGKRSYSWEENTYETQSKDRPLLPNALVATSTSRTQSAQTQTRCRNQEKHASQWPHFALLKTAEATADEADAVVAVVVAAAAVAAVVEVGIVVVAAALQQNATFAACDQLQEKSLYLWGSHCRLAFAAFDFENHWKKGLRDVGTAESAATAVTGHKKKCDIEITINEKKKPEVADVVAAGDAGEGTEVDPAAAAAMMAAEAARATTQAYSRWEPAVLLPAASAESAAFVASVQSVRSVPRAVVP